MKYASTFQYLFTSETTSLSTTTTTKTTTAKAQTTKTEMSTKSTTFGISIGSFNLLQLRITVNIVSYQGH